MSATSVGQIGLDLVVNQNKFNKQMVGVQSLAKKTGKILVAAFGVKQLINYSKQCVNLASDLQEVQNVADVAFPSMTAKMDKFAKSAAANFGLSETMAKKYSSLYGTMAKQFGFAEESAYEMGTTLAGLAGDVASFYNMTQDEAYTKLKAVFSGETEVLKDIGIVMTQDALDAYALAQGFDKTTKSMSEAEKVALRYSFIQNQLSAATGDFLRTSDSWANQTRLLKLNLEQLGATIGGSLINMLKPLVRTLNFAISKFTEFAQAISDSLGKVFGWTYDTGGVAADLETGANSANDISSGIENAASNAKKLKQQLSGIDELNVISTNTGNDSNGSTSIGSNGAGTIGSGWKQTESIIDGFEGKFGKLEKLFQDIKIGDWFSVGQDVSNIVTSIFDFFSRAIASVDWTELGRNIGFFLEGVDWVDVLDSLGNLIWTAVNSVIKTWGHSFDVAPIETGIITAVALWNWMGVGKIIATKIATAIAANLGTTPVITTISAAFKALFGSEAAKSALTFMFSGLSSALLNPMTIAIGGLVAGIPTLFVGIYDAIKNGLDWLNSVLIPAGATAAGAGIGAIIGMLGGPIGAGIGALIGLAVGLVTDGVILIVEKWDSIKEWFSGIGEWFNKQVIEPIKKVWDPIANWFNENLVEPVVGFFEGFKIRASQIFEGLWLIIQAVWIVVSEWFNQYVVQPIVNFFQPIINKVSGCFEQAWTKIKEVWADVSDWFDELVIQPVVETWEKATEKIGGFFSGLWSGIKKGVIDAMNSVISGIEKGINFLVSGINKILKGFNKVAGWAANVVGEDYGGVDLISKVSLSRIPALAEGGYVKANTPQLAMIGDNLHQGEIVSPEDKLEQMALKAAQMAKSHSDNTDLKQIILLLKKQNELLMGILEKETGITQDDIGKSARKWAKEFYDRTGDEAYSF